MLWLLTAQAIGFVAAGAAGFRLFPGHHDDLRIYIDSSRRVDEGEMPYRDFTIEYPPLALVPFTLPRAFATRPLATAEQYRTRFILVMAACSTLLAFLMRAAHVGICGAGPGARPMAIYAVAVTILGPLLAWRYDLFPAALTAAATWAYVTRRTGTAGVMLGFGIAAKLYPAVLAPIFLADATARRDRTALVRFAAGAGLALVATILPFAVIASAGLGWMLDYHASRGLEIGSTAAGLALLAGNLGLADVSHAVRFGGAEVEFASSAIVLRLLPALAAGSLLVITALVYLRFRKDVAAGRTTSLTLVSGLTLALLAFMATNKVFSPQYVAWLLPFVPLLPARHGVLWLVACVLTVALYPWQFMALFEQERGAILLLNLRNLLVVAEGVLVVRLLRS